MTIPMPQASWRLEFGSRPVDGGIVFRTWAPLASRLAVRIIGDGLFPMEREDDEIFRVLVPQRAAGVDYLYVIDEAKERPDPVSRRQPDGVHGPSRVVDPGAFDWGDHEWHGLALEEYVIYELHVGTFTAAGTFAATIEKLGYLRDFGVNAVELMPVAEFPGARNWGYDGVYPYAPHSAYGGPAGLKTLVDACHRQGLAVILDVVYNHLGPEGNYLADFAPYFTNRYLTPWGDAINFDGPFSDGVRRYFVDNALHWLTEYHIDALRLDAIHGIFDSGARHILREIGETFHAVAQSLERRAHVIAESDLNDVRVINPLEAGGHGLDAQWNDDFHHALHTVLTGAREGYFTDFGRVADLCKALRDGFVYDGRYSIFRRRRHGNSSAGRAGRQFVVFTQNHDQVANTTAGERLSDLVPAEAQKLAAMVLVCAPDVPMLFMGQEFAATTPFLYFTSFIDADLAQAVSEGRKREYEGFLRDRPFSDPQSFETYARSHLNWNEPQDPRHAAILDFHRSLLALRRRHPCLANCRKDLTRAECDETQGWMTVERADPSGCAALLLCNFRGDARSLSLPRGGRSWRLALWNGDPRYGGPAQAANPPAILDRNDRAVALGGFGAALYLTDNCR
ncbi:MAG TPA: malto-oligosyltrehalose trehalohydrolase [Candidatus Binataceae bacterium]|nr:malto-oligosyltrehalose trehalohydrolase [Candidatus Binataceae bacterium]